MKQLGKYEIIEEIGRGGFATVYKARDTKLDRIVALKVLAPHLTFEPTFVKRFHREARAVARLRHPHIVVVHDIGEEAGQVYMAMECLPGCTLAQKVQEVGALPLTQVVTIVSQVAEALDYAHNRGLLHRDLKPSNIMVEETKHGMLQVTLMDFGLVKVLEGSRYIRSTASITGTPEYMSPEQAEGLELDRRSDMYALGLVAYELCTGRAPFTAPSPLAVLRFQVEKSPPLPRQLNPELLPEIERVLLKALAKSPEARYQRAGDLASALKAALAINAMMWEKDHKEMIRIPAGEFVYGDAKETRELPEFWIDKTPVTNTEFARFVKATDYRTTAEDQGYGWVYQRNDWNRVEGADWRYPEGPETNIDDRMDHPVVQVSWFDAVEYAKWAGKRLPTEEEWEKAARGTQGQSYPWGEQVPTSELCNYGENEEGTTPVGRYSPQCDSFYGCVDMAGNVWEWTASDHEKGGKVLRGGSWFNYAGFMRSAYRAGFEPALQNIYSGFRCARSSE